MSNYVSLEYLESRLAQLTPPTANAVTYLNINGVTLQAPTQSAANLFVPFEGYIKYNPNFGFSVSEPTTITIHKGGMYYVSWRMSGRMNDANLQLWLNGSRYNALSHKAANAYGDNFADGVIVISPGFKAQLCVVGSSVYTIDPMGASLTFVQLSDVVS